MEAGGIALPQASINPLEHNTVCNARGAFLTTASVAMVTHCRLPSEDGSVSSNESGKLNTGRSSSTRRAAASKSSKADAHTRTGERGRLPQRPPQPSLSDSHLAINELACSHCTSTGFSFTRQLHLSRHKHISHTLTTIANTLQVDCFC